MTNRIYENANDYLDKFMSEVHGYRPCPSCGEGNFPPSVLLCWQCKP